MFFWGGWSEEHLRVFVDFEDLILRHRDPQRCHVCSCFFHVSIPALKELSGNVV